MDWFVKAFLKSSLAWLGAGVTLGLAMAMHPPWAVYRTAHLHMNLLGFVGMMIFGVALHVLPRFTGRALYSERLADAQFALANLGLLAMVLGWLGGARLAAAAGGTLLWVGFALFALNVAATVRPWRRRG